MIEVFPGHPAVTRTNADSAGVQIFKIRLVSVPAIPLSHGR